MVKFLLFFLTTLYFANSSFGQDRTLLNYDNDIKLTFDELIGAIKRVEDDTIQAKKFIQLYFEKARKENRPTGIAHAHLLMSKYVNQDSIRICHLDSAIELTRNIKSIYYPMLPYFYKGHFYLDKENYSYALDNFLRALEYSRKNNHELYEYNAKHNIGMVKGEIGQYDEAIEIFQECLVFEKKREVFDDYGYSVTLLNLGENAIKNKNLDSAKVYLEEGLRRTKFIHDDLYNRLKFQKGHYLIATGDYVKAKKLIKNTKTQFNFKQTKNKKLQIVSHYFLGLAELGLGNNRDAERHFLLMDSLSITDNLRPLEIREGYSYLIKHLKSPNDRLKIINNVLLFDSIVTRNGIEILDKLHDDFDTPELVKERNLVIDQLRNDKSKKNTYYIISLVTLLITIVLLITQTIKKNKLNKKFEMLLDNSIETEKLILPKPIPNNLRTSSISESIVEKILKGLEVFENQKKFLNNELTASKLAESLNTNSRYLSLVINDHKQKSFSTYIKDLRISNAIEELKKNEKLRNSYTIRGIALEMGFNNAESFSTAFKNKTGIKPSYFIKRLNGQTTPNS